MSGRSARARRSQQVLFGVFSLIVVVSMGLALVSVPNVTTVLPTATPTSLPVLQPTPTRLPTATPTAKP
jgi:hypothetical protein